MFVVALFPFFLTRSGHVGSGVVHAGGVAAVPTPAVPAGGTSRRTRRVPVANVVVGPVVVVAVQQHQQQSANRRPVD